MKLNKRYTLAAAFFVAHMVAALSQAGSATWNLNPTDGDWNTAENWTPNTVPNSETDVATFGQSNVTEIALSQTVLGSQIFGPDASAYTFTLQDASELAYYGLYGDGVINNSAYEQTFVFPANDLYGVNVEFRNSSTAGDRVTYYFNNGGSGAGFFDSSNAGSANIIVGTSFLDFYGPAPAAPSAANATIDNNPGYTTFSFGGTAGNAMITNEYGGWTDFDLGGDAGNATIINEGTLGSDGWQSHTYFGGSAGTATVTNNPAAVQGGKGGYTDYGTDLASSPTIINNGSSFPSDDTAGITFITGPGANAGNVNLIAHGGINGGAGGGIVFDDKVANGSAVRAQLDGNAYLDISLRIRPGVTIGSVEGSGKVYLGANNLSIGANNLSTQYSGHIEDGNRNNRTGGSITKIGTGTLTLTGANTYTGGTTVTAGALLVSNIKNSGTGTGNLEVNAGTLGGTGIISGPVTIGTGSGSGAILAPSVGSKKPLTLSLTNTLTFKGDSTYTCQLSTRKAEADEVIAKGVTITSGTQFNLQTAGSTTLTSGTVFTVISNSSGIPISGTFANLADGATITVGTNLLKADYEGGDGNDLTLTVVR